ncbi:hypothetical protein [Paraburkholderia sp. SIMBA_054]|uniref:hypothetical protein n=1 Tax=Paraburkholderia sp. SIMBA_054 TaxID=3085795 RepID=UPI00397BDFD4
MLDYVKLSGEAFALLPAIPLCYAIYRVFRPSADDVKRELAGSPQAMTKTEKAFHARLVEALPRERVFPHRQLTGVIRMIATGVPLAKSPDATDRMQYGIYTNEEDLLVIVELVGTDEDRKGNERDAPHAATGVRIVRFRQDGMPGIEAIRAAVFPRDAGALAPRG